MQTQSQLKLSRGFKVTTEWKVDIDGDRVSLVWVQWVQLHPKIMRMADFAPTDFGKPNFVALILKPTFTGCQQKMDPLPDRFIPFLTNFPSNF